VLFTAVAISPAHADYSNTVASFNPIAYWRLNETAPPSPPLNLVTNYGSAGSAGNGVVVRACTKGQPGEVGKSILIANSGAGSQDVLGKVDVPFNAALNPSPPWTVEFWANPNRNDNTLCALSSMDCLLAGEGSRKGWLFYLDLNFGWEFRLGDTSGYLFSTACSSGLGAVTVGGWQHVVGTFDGTTAQIYVNGVLKASAVAPRPWTPNTEMPLMFGAFSLNAGGTYIDGPCFNDPTEVGAGIAGSRGFDGYLDEVAIYPSLLSASTIAAHYAAATTNAAGYDAQILASNPVGYWNCDEPAVTAPAPSTFPIAVNTGTIGSAANGTNYWGDLAAQSGPPYVGMGGAANKACFFDGDNGYIALGDAPGMHFSGNITMMAWVKPLGSINFFRNIIGHGWDGGYIETFLRIAQGDDGTFASDGTNNYEVGVSPDGTVVSYDANIAKFPIPPGDVGNWVFIAGTYDGAAWNLYRNGQLVAQTVTSQGALDVTNRWSIGSRSGPSPTTGTGSATLESEGLFFNGYIDEPAIFNTALTPANIATIYNAAQVPPVITRPVQVPPGSYKGSSPTFTVWADGNPTLHYAWTSNGIPVGGNVTNVTLNNLAAGNLTVAVVVTNVYGSATSSNFFTVVASKPLITQQPIPIKRFVGYPFQFSVAAAGTFPISYQWNTNNVPIPGATSPTYSGTVSAATAGSYSCTLTNEAGISNTISAPLIAVPVPAGYPAAVVASGPIAYYRLDETNGSTVCYDFINGINGIYSKTTLQVPGYSVLDPDTAASFSGLNSYVGSISGMAINFTGHTNFTLEAWVNAPAGQNDEATIIGKGIGAIFTTRTEQFSLDVAIGAYRFFTTRGDQVYEADAISGPNGTWQHIVGVYDDQGIIGPGTNMYIYVNGVLEGQNRGNPSGLNGTTSPVSIGSKRTGNDPNYDGTFEGTIDEVAVYSQPLDSTTIQTHYAAAYGPNTAPFINVQPSPLTNYNGLVVTFSVSAAGTQPLQYTWKRNNVALSDGPTANGSTIGGSSTERMTISSLSLLDAGSYSVGITNGINPGTKSISVPLVVLPTPTSPPAIPGLVLHLPFDNDLNDATGRGNNAVSIHTTTNPVTGGGYSSNMVAATFVTDGVLNQAFHYETDAINIGGGVSYGTNDYYATLGMRPDLQFSSNANFSVAYWIRLHPLGFQGGDLPAFTDAKGSSGGFGYAFATAYGYGTANPNPTTDPSGWLGCWDFTIFGAGGQNVGNGQTLYGSNLGTQPGIINDEQWHHLVYVFDRTAGSGMTYLDGVFNRGIKQNGNSLRNAGNIDSGLPATIGQDPTGLYGEIGSADIDDLGVWRKALTPVEAASIYVAAVSNKLSFVSAPITLTIQQSGGQVIVSFNCGTLQSAPDVTGPYTDVTSDSPLVVTPTTRQFYRVHL
jgi:hypothetical protein